MALAKFLKTQKAHCGLDCTGGAEAVAGQVLRGLYSKSLQFAVCSLQFAVWSLQFAVWSLQFAVCSLQLSRRVFSCAEGKIGASSTINFKLENANSSKAAKSACISW